MKNYYILIIEESVTIDKDILISKLDLALDWIHIMSNVFIIESTADKIKWYKRLKPVFNGNKFFLTEIDLSNSIGWMPKWIWSWIKEKAKI
ncbi:MAG: hypothetical protein AABW92_01965 [Nanoarchaeota archaeon]